MLEHASDLKDLFIQIASKSAFPQVGWQDFSAWSNKTNIPDARVGATTSIIDTCFIAAKVEPVPVKGMSKEFLMRHKFLELLVRISKCKYIEINKETSVARSFSRLMKDVILKEHVWEPRMQFRREKLWTLDVDDVLKNN